jgi:NitT/TauT family transport system permease protein
MTVPALNTRPASAASGTAPAAAVVPISARRARRGAPRRRVVVSLQILVIAAFLAGWEFLPQIPALSENFAVFNSDYVSSPSLVFSRVWELMVGEGSSVLWSSLGNTLLATVYGLVVGSAVGIVGGLLLSQSPFAAKVARPYISLLNATPLIAFLPIIVVIFGISITATSVAAGLLVVCLVFFNALEGGSSVRAEILQNAKLLGAGQGAVMLRVRLPYVIAWVFAVLPAAMSFALVGVVATEFMVGVPGIGKLITLALSFDDTTLTIALAVILGITGVLLYAALTEIQARLMHWWGK